MASGLFWTGFPVFLNDFGRSSLDLSQIYAYATFGSLAFGLAGGILSDLGSCKLISILSQSITVVLIGGIFLAWGHFDKHWIMYLLPILYFNFSLAGIAELVWILNFDQESELKNKILDRALLTFLAKLIGFSGGPILFNLMGQQSLLLCMGLFGVVVLLQMFLKDGKKTVGPVNVAVSLQAILRLAKSPAFVVASVLTGLLAVPVNPMFVAHSLKIGGPNDATWFWALAGAAGFANLFLQRMGWLRFTIRQAGVVTALLIGSAMIAFSAEHIHLFFAGSSLYVFGSLLFSMQLYLRVGSASIRSNLGGSFGLLNLLVDTGIFVGMVLGSEAAALSTTWLMLALGALLIARSIAFSKLVAGEHRAL